MEKRQVVITGAGLLSPLGLTIKENWDSLVAGRSGVGPITSFDCRSIPTRFAGEIKDFSPRAFVQKAKSLKLMNRTIQLGVAAASLALTDSRLEAGTFNPESMGIALGTMGLQYTLEDAVAVIHASAPKETLQGAALDSMDETPLNPIWPLTFLPNMTLCHIAILNQIQGPNMTFSATGSAGAQAIGEAAHSIIRGEADLYLAGGASALNPLYLISFSASKTLSTRNEEPERACRPFEKGRDGFVLAEGAAVVVLEEVEHARGRNAPIYAEVCGYHSSFGSGTTASLKETTAGAALCMEQALEGASLDPGAIGYISADGRGSPLSDRAETEAIKKVFGPLAKKTPVSSIKSMTGHMLCAAGSAEAIIGALILREGLIPPTINYEHPDPECDLYYVPNVAERRRADALLSLSLGLGGEHAALVLKRFAP
jgi:3-oxoacyl-[acyl-carrier-protein] synthase II